MSLKHLKFSSLQILTCLPKIERFLEIWSCRLRVGVLWPVATCSNRSKTQVQLSMLPLNKKTAPVQNSNIASVSNNWNRHNSGFRCIGQRTRRIQTSSLFCAKILRVSRLRHGNPLSLAAGLRDYWHLHPSSEKRRNCSVSWNKTTGVWWGKKNTSTPQLVCVTTCHLATEIFENAICAEAKRREVEWWCVVSPKRRPPAKSVEKGQILVNPVNKVITFLGLP